MTESVIVLEFNELTPRLMDQFIAEGHLPGFARLRRESIVCVSDAEEAAPSLEPWIQWITVHTGLSYAEHGVFDLGDGPRLDAPRIWDFVADAGERAWVCGSMNAATKSKRKENLYVLPDPWSREVPPHPEALFRPYFNLIRTYVQEYTRDKVPLGKSDYLDFGRFMVANGLSPKTVFATLRQLASERTGPYRWRRAAILDRLQWDIFRHFYRRLKPRLSTFFLNSTAHYQHYYWRNMAPTLFAKKDTDERQAQYADAILFGYKKMDEIVTECMNLAPDATIVLATALGQQPLLKYEETGGKQIFKVNEIKHLMKFAAIEQAYEYAPVMAEEFTLIFANVADAEDAERRLKALRMPDGAPVMNVRRDETKLFCGCAVITSQDEDAEISTPYSNRPVLFERLFYPIDGVKSGSHHPDGIFWIRTPSRKHLVVDRKISIREMAPTLLKLCGIRTNHPFSRKPMPEIAEADVEPLPMAANM
jgi:hypothetical protein